MKDEEYIKEYEQTRGIQPQTTKNIRIILRHYTNFQQMTLHELLTEADLEEENRIRWKNRTLKKRLVAYQNHLRTTMTISSAKYYLKNVKSFYKHHEIEIHNLPPLNEKNSILPPPVTFDKLPNREVIKQAIEIASPVMKPIILLMSSSGMSKVDILNLTINDFFEATSEYHQQLDPNSTIFFLQNIARNTDIVPVWRLRRKKTSKYFVTFSTPESTVEILNYLVFRSNKKELRNTDKLFKINPTYFNAKFQEINDALGLGRLGHYNRFRSHNLRKFQASQLANDGMDRYLINVLQGKSNGSVDDVYFFEDESKLREEYLKHMHCLLIFSEVREVTVYSEEFLELKKENTALKEQMEDVQKLREEIEKIKEWFVF